MTSAGASPMVTRDLSREVCRPRMTTAWPGRATSGSMAVIRGFCSRVTGTALVRPSGVCTDTGTVGVSPSSSGTTTCSDVSVAAVTDRLLRSEEDGVSGGVRGEVLSGQGDRLARLDRLRA